ncbi:hypothetical protein SUGI_0245860 [Cryptomeria japonica]|nr:hypothetical protein SUGI_0245860 [Cryptomeria japonica]
MGYLLFKVAVALVLVMNCPLSRGDANEGATAYFYVQQVQQTSQSLLDYVKSNDVGYCVGAYQFVNDQTNSALVNLHYQSADKGKAAAALSDLAQTKARANECTDALKTDRDERIRNLLGYVLPQNSQLDSYIDAANDELQKIING